MKKILVILLLPIFCYAQQSPSLLKTTKDKFTDVETTELKKPIILPKNKSSYIIVNLSKDSRFDFPILNFIVMDHTFGCSIEQTSHEVYFIFADGRKFQAYNSSTGCNKNAILLLKGGPAINEDLPSFLQTDEIAAIRITNDGPSYEITLNKSDAVKIKNAAIEFFAGNELGIGKPIDSSAPAPKRARLPAPARTL